MGHQEGESSLPKAFCVLPWTQMATTVKGFARLCCFAKNLRDENGNRIVISAASSFGDLWNSEAYRRV
ncbi:MAG: hypothetical protein KDD43_17120, partial [Bdellovibrionales bacterium]|nr:hypothetical protein [Bdellovibrionales bacterium]